MRIYPALISLRLCDLWKLLPCIGTLALVVNVNNFRWRGGIEGLWLVYSFVARQITFSVKVMSGFSIYAWASSKTFSNLLRVTL